MDRYIHCVSDGYWDFQNRDHNLVAYKIKKYLERQNPKMVVWLQEYSKNPKNLPNYHDHVINR